MMVLFGCSQSPNRAVIADSPLPLYSGGEGLGVRGLLSRQGGSPLTPTPLPPSGGEGKIASRARNLLVVRRAAVDAVGQGTQTLGNLGGRIIDHDRHAVVVGPIHRF